MSDYIEAEATARNQQWLNQAPQFHIPFEPLTNASPASTSASMSPTASEADIGPDVGPVAGPDAGPETDAGAGAGATVDVDVDVDADVDVDRADGVPPVATTTTPTIITTTKSHDADLIADSAPSSPRSAYAKFPTTNNDRRMSAVSQASASSSTSVSTRVSVKKKVFDLFHDNSSTEKLGGELGRVNSLPNSSNLPLLSPATSTATTLMTDDKKKRHRFHLLPKRRHYSAADDFDHDLTTSATPPPPSSSLSPLPSSFRPKIKSRMFHNESENDIDDTASLSSMAGSLKHKKPKRSLLGKFIHRKDSDSSDRDNNFEYTLSGMSTTSTLSSRYPPSTTTTATTVAAIPQSPAASFSTLNFFDQSPLESTENNNDPLSRQGSMIRTSSKFSLSSLTNKSARKERGDDKIRSSHTSLLNLLPGRVNNTTGNPTGANVNGPSATMASPLISPMTSTVPIMWAPTKSTIGSTATTKPVADTPGTTTKTSPMASVNEAPGTTGTTVADAPMTISLDTDLEHMAGIVNPHKSPGFTLDSDEADTQEEYDSDTTTTTHFDVEVNSVDMDATVDTHSISTDSFAGSATGEAWTAPESWAVEEISLPDMDHAHIPRAAIPFSTSTTTDPTYYRTSRKRSDLDDTAPLSPFSSSLILPDGSGDLGKAAGATSMYDPSSLSTTNPSTITTDHHHDEITGPPPTALTETVNVLSTDFVNNRKSTTMEAVKPPHTTAFIRIFRQDGSFSTVPCFMDTTVSELLQILGRKYFLPSIVGYQLTATVGGLTRLMGSSEYPLVIQHRLLKSVGYRSNDRLNEIGREDLSYLCKFKFSKRHAQTYYDENGGNRDGGTTDHVDINGEFGSVAENLIDFKNVQLGNHGLQIIPILFYKHSGTIESLDVSKNPLISVPLDFIQSCPNLRHVNFSHNRARQLPLNIIQTGRLKSLNLSCNYLSELPETMFDKLSNLVSLELQGNMITELPTSFARLSNIKYLNLSSNSLLEFPEVICQLDTLVDVMLSFNQISLVPTSISKLTKLQRLTLDNNRLTKRLPSTFAALKLLREINISNNQLQNVDNLARLPGLEVLDASKNSITYMINNSFSKIQSLIMNHNPITMVSCNIPLTNLSSLDLSRAKLASFTDGFLEKTLGLERLILDSNHFVSLPTALCSLKRLTYFSCAVNNLASIPAEIGQLTNLRYLDIHANNLRKLPEEIWNLSELAYLNASSNLLDAFPKQNFHSASVSSTDTLYKLNSAAAALAAAESSQKTTTTSEFSADYELKFARRPSEFSMASNALSPMETSRRGSIVPPPLSLTASPKIGTISDISPPPNQHYNNSARSSPLFNSNNNPRVRYSLVNSLRVLLLADNRLTDDSFEEISLFCGLQVLNMSYNELVDIPYGALGRLTQLTELYLSGNMMTSLPADDLENLESLVVLYVNGNKLHTLPAELGKIPHLAVLDVGSNQLKYNISNWPYDWNWNFNLELQYLNFSGNKRLEIKRSNYNNQFVSVRGSEITDLSDFTVLAQLKTLGLMDVTLTTSSVPDQSENCRVRTYGSEIHNMPYGLADCLGNKRDNLSNIDMVIERFRGNENEVILGLFDGRNENPQSGNRVSKLLQETFGKAFTEELKKMRDNDTVSDALYRAFLSTNKEIGLAVLTPADERASGAPSAHRSITAAHLNTNDGSTGSCATICYINEQSLYVANVGDTTAILATGDGQYHVVTGDHTLTNQAEQARIRACGGLISPDAKLDGVVGVSRAFGFYNIIPYIMTAPNIVEHTISESDELLIVASQELWQYMNHETAVDIARTEKDDPMLAAQKLRDFALAYGANDKIMVMCVAIGGSRRSKQQRDKIKAIPGGVGGSSLYGNTMAGSQGPDDDIYPIFRRKRDKSLLPEDSNLARLGGEVDPPVGELAMVFTDIKNSTILWESYPTAMRSAIKIHNSVMRRQLRIMGGYEVKTEGDAFMVSFPTPVSSLLWCLFVQSQLLVADWPAEILESNETCEIEDKDQNILYRGLSVRMGIHWGTPVCERDPITRRMDYFGPMVNRAARVSAVADGGQIMVSADFLSEMRRLEIIYKKTQESGQMIYEAYGDEELGMKITKGMKMLESVGWVVKEVGESKLKGLENPEFLSMVSSTQLAGRMSFTTPTENSIEMPKEDNSPSVFFSNQRRLLLGGEITMEALITFRDLSLRLENLCSNLNGSKTVGTEKKHSGTSPALKKSTRPLGLALVARSEASKEEHDLALLLEHVVTRIENSILNMYVRMAINRSENKPGLIWDKSAEHISVDSIMGLLSGLSLKLEKKRSLEADGDNDYDV